MFLSSLFISRQEIVHPTGSTSFFEITETTQERKREIEKERNKGRKEGRGGKEERMEGTRKRNVVLACLGLSINVK